jgi:hypothetical protein
VEATQRFDIGNEMRGGVGAEIGVRITGQGPAAARPALVEQHNPVDVGIEESSLARGTA